MKVRQVIGTGLTAGLVVTGVGAFSKGLEASTENSRSPGVSSAETWTITPASQVETVGYLGIGVMSALGAASLAASMDILQSLSNESALSEQKKSES